jgi:hypothetical protein
MPKGVPRGKQADRIVIPAEDFAMDLSNVQEPEDEGYIPPEAPVIELVTTPEPEVYQQAPPPDISQYVDPADDGDPKEETSTISNTIRRFGSHGGQSTPDEEVQQKDWRTQNGRQLNPDAPAFPPQELPFRNPTSADIKPNERQEKRNDLGLKVESREDDCFHLNASWKGGTCIEQGNIACPFLGGNQGQCQLYRSRQNPPTRRRFGNPDVVPNRASGMRRYRG